MVYKTIEVEVDLSDYSDEDLLDELDERRGGSGIYVTSERSLLHIIWEKRRLNQDFTKEIDLLIYDALGKTI